MSMWNVVKPKELAGTFLTGLVWLVIFGGTLVPLGFSLGSWLPRFNNTLLEGNNIYIVSAALLLAFGLVRLLYRADLSGYRYFWLLGMLAACATAAKVFYAFSFEQDFYSDFRTMWNYALEVYEAGAFTPPDRPQTERPLASLVPLVWMFGPSESVFKLANVVFTVSTALMVASMTARIVSRHAAIFVFVLIMAVPEVYFALLIPTHDIPGVFYLVLYIFILFWAWMAIAKGSFDNHSPRTHLSILLIVLSLFLVAMLLDIQRNVYLPVSLSLLLFSTYLYFSGSVNKARKGRIVIVLILLTAPLALEIGTSKLLRNEGLLATSSFNQLYRGPSTWYRHTFTDGTFATGSEFGRKYLDGITDAHLLTRLKDSLTFSDIYYNILERPSNFLLRSQHLYALGTQSSFYFGWLKGLSREELRSISTIKEHYNTVFVTAYVILLLASVSCILFRRSRPLSKVLTLPLIVMSVITLALTLIAENQPRYLFMGWFLWSPVVAWFVDSLFAKGIDNTLPFNTSRSQETPFWNGRGVTSVLLVALLGYLLFRGLFYFSDTRFIDMRTWSNPICNLRIGPVECQRSVISFQPDLSDKPYSTLKLQLPLIPKTGDFARVERAFDVSSDGLYELSLFVMSPYKRGDGKTGYFDINVYIDGTIVRTLHLEDTDQYHFVHLQDLAPENDTLHVGLEVRSNVDQSSQSWQRASEAHFKFMSIYRAENN